jgi:hypothetical protein
MSAANAEKDQLASIDVQRIQVWNMSPAHYRKEDPKAAKGEELRSMGDAYDLLDLKH